jgi:hypothetical protein
MSQDINGDYVPTGLSMEEYQLLKDMEKQREQSMDYGSFGPRFKRTKEINGDWFLMPTLWTHGVHRMETRKYSSTTGGVHSHSSPSLPSFLRYYHQTLFHVVNGICTTTVQRYSPAFVMILVAWMILRFFMSIDMNTAFAYLIATPTTTILPTDLKLSLKSWMIQPTAAATAWNSFKTQHILLPAITAATFSPWIENYYLDYCNHRYLWTRRRTIGTTVVIVSLASFLASIMKSFLFIPT